MFPFSNNLLNGLHAPYPHILLQNCQPWVRMVSVWLRAAKVLVCWHTHNIHAAWVAFGVIYWLKIQREGVPTPTLIVVFPEIQHHLLHWCQDYIASLSISGRGPTGFSCICNNLVCPPRPCSPRLPPPRPAVVNVAILGIENCAIGGCNVGASW